MADERRFWGPLIVSGPRDTCLQVVLLGLRVCTVRCTLQHLAGHGMCDTPQKFVTQR